MYTLKISLGLVLLLPLSDCLADNVQVYRWVDENNIVHFSQYQPKHNNFTELMMYSSKNVKDNNMPSQDSPSTPVNVAQPASSEKCEEAKSNVSTLENFDLIQYKNTEGEVQVLTKEEKAEQLTINKKNVDTFCGP